MKLHDSIPAKMTKIHSINGVQNWLFLILFVICIKYSSTQLESNIFNSKFDFKSSFENTGGNGECSTELNAIKNGLENGGTWAMKRK